MDAWNLIYLIATPVLTAAILGVWKPWASAYGGEKGKNLARKEDLNEILAEVRAVALAQKEVESKLSGALWDRQVRWGQKREVYGALLDSLYEFSASVSLLPEHIIKLNKSRGTPQEGSVANNYYTYISTLPPLLAKFTKAVALAVIFCSVECNRLLTTYGGKNKLGVMPTLTLEEAKEQSILVEQLWADLVREAKNDLGV